MGRRDGEGAEQPAVGARPPGRAVTAPTHTAGRFVGQAVLRKEDPRLLTGRGRYPHAVELPHMLHAHFLRSALARAKITRLDVSSARELPGVVAVLTGADLN